MRGEEEKGGPGSAEVSRLTEHLFRHEAGRLVAVLTGIFGIERLQMAEDVVQEALLKALKTWPCNGIPENPAAWLTQAAKNRALDLLRREKRFRDKEPAIAIQAQLGGGQVSVEEAARFDSELRDDRLRLMFACCHPCLPAESQTVLALKTLCGFSPGEIAQAFFSTEPAVNKRLTRARVTLREQGVCWEIPAGDALKERLDGVLRTLYLLFNEGYKASAGAHLVREELCAEATRLTELLASHPAGDRPETHALLALMWFNRARLPARIAEDGSILRLREQDRSKWDPGMCGRGLAALARSGSGDAVSMYHLQAGILACHMVAPDYASTDWARILTLYDCLVGMDPSPVVLLNRAVAVAEAEGPAHGLAALDALHGNGPMEGYYLYHAVRAELYAEIGEPAAAARCLRDALRLAEVASERELLADRLSRLGQLPA